MAEKGKKGFVYLLTNLYMPDLVKIGRCDSDDEKKLTTRVSSLYSGQSGVPVRFDIRHVIRVNNPRHVEKELHEAFKDERVNPRREFFEVAHETENEQGTIKKLIRLMNLIGEPIKVGNLQPDAGIERVDEEAHDRAARKIKRRARFNFDIVEIDEDAVLTFSKDSSITATVVGGNVIKYEGEQTTLSDATARILREKFGGSSKKGYSGPLHWEYNGEILDELRRRLESGESE